MCLKFCCAGLISTFRSRPRATALGTSRTALRTSLSQRSPNLRLGDRSREVDLAKPEIIEVLRIKFNTFADWHGQQLSHIFPFSGNALGVRIAKTAHATDSTDQQ